MASRFTYFEPDEKIVDTLTKELSCDPVVSSLLIGRGITDAESANFFLFPDFSQLTDPFQMKDVDKAVQRIFTAINNQEKILVFGDFDADGITSTTLLCQFLEYCNANISWYIPHRIKEGYSLQPDHIQMAVDQDIDLIITVDCGVTSIDAVNKALLEDIDTIITDHHEPGGELPKACAVINPKQKDCHAGLDYLAGVGVAFFLVMALRKHLRNHDFWGDIAEPNLSDYLDLFTIGTIGDMVPLIHDNRVLCKAGITKIQKGGRAGLAGIAKVCRLDMEKIDSDDISFKIIPRINAAGRISHARICVSLLMDTDVTSSENTASVLDQLNVKRQEIEADIVKEIEVKLLEHPELLNQKILFLWHDKWHPAVLGIAASRLSRKYFRPVILLSTASDQAVGSGRSINQINIYQMLTANDSLLVKYGGHAMACGLTVEKKQLEQLSETFNQYLEQTHGEDDFERTAFIDAVLEPEQITVDLADAIDQLRPFGTANPEPVFLCRNLKVASSVLIAGKHRKMGLKNAAAMNTSHIEAFHFNINNPGDLPDYYSQITFKLKRNKFKPNAAQIIVEDL